MSKPRSVLKRVVLSLLGVLVALGLISLTVEYVGSKFQKAPSPEEEKQNKLRSLQTMKEALQRVIQKYKLREQEELAKPVPSQKNLQRLKTSITVATRKLKEVEDELKRHE